MPAEPVSPAFAEKFENAHELPKPVQKPAETEFDHRIVDASRPAVGGGGNGAGESAM